MTPFNIDVPDEYLLRIGKITVAWGDLEGIVDLALAKLGGFDHDDPRGRILTAHMTWPLKMDTLEAFADSLTTGYPWLRRFSKAKPLLKAAQDGRNRVAHGAWSYEGGQVRKLRATARGKLKTSVAPITVADLDEILAAIGHAGRALLDVIFDTDKYSGVGVTDDST